VKRGERAAVFWGLVVLHFSWRILKKKINKTRVKQKPRHMEDKSQNYPNEKKKKRKNIDHRKDWKKHIPGGTNRCPRVNFTHEKKRPKEKRIKESKKGGRRKKTRAPGLKGRGGPPGFGQSGGPYDKIGVGEEKRLF